MCRSPKIAEMEKTLERHAGEICAVLVEPLMHWEKTLLLSL